CPVAGDWCPRRAGAIGLLRAATRDARLPENRLVGQWWALARCRCVRRAGVRVHWVREPERGHPLSRVARWRLRLASSAPDSDTIQRFNGLRIDMMDTNLG